MFVNLLFVCSVVVVLQNSIAFAQQSGAYSSPQYAKKAYYNQKYNNQHSYTDPYYQKISQSENQKNERSKHQDIDISEYSNHHQIESPNSKTFQNFTSNNENENIASRSNLNIASHQNNFINSNGGNETQSGRSTGGFMQSAGQFLNGGGGQMLADIARELITRSTGASSQVGAVEGCWLKVLSLNLTNLVILVILKALILAAGMFGAGTWTHGYARSLEDNSNSQLISGSELDLWMSYLRGKPECLQLAACKSPKLAKRYSGGADLLLTVAKFTNGIMPYDIRYENLLDHVKEATAWGSTGMICEDKFKCV